MWTLRERARILALTLGLGAGAGAAGASTIDFESIPGATPSEYLSIGDQFRASHGVRFRMQGGGMPVLAQVGGPMVAFGGGAGNLPDTPNPDQGVGSFFLTDDGSVAAPPRPLWIVYDDAVAAASGTILDVDFWGNAPSTYEAFTVEAFGSRGQRLGEVEVRSGDPGTGDGIASYWAFDLEGDARIVAIRVAYTGTKDFGVGLAFDNFSPSAVGAPPLPAGNPGAGGDAPAIPEPGAAAIFATGLALATRRRSTASRTSAPAR